jgi:hypothetical protein
MEYWHKSLRLLWQSYLIYISLRAVGIQKFFRTKDGGGAPATPILFSFRIAIYLKILFITQPPPTLFIKVFIKVRVTK